MDRSVRLSDPAGTVGPVEIEPRPEPLSRPPTDAERETAAERLVDAAGDGRLTLEEFSDRVGAVWGAGTTEQLALTTADIEAAPPVGSTRTMGRVVSIMGDQTRSGRWRLPARVRGWCLMGDIHLDLRSVVCSEPEVDIRTWTLMGDVEVVVPDGVEVELGGFDVMGDRELRLAPVPRVPGTPLIRVRCYTLMGDVKIRSSTADEPGPSGWRRWLMHGTGPRAVPPPPADPPEISR